MFRCLDAFTTQYHLTKAVPGIRIPDRNCHYPVLFLTEHLIRHLSDVTKLLEESHAMAPHTQLKKTKKLK